MSYTAALRAVAVHAAMERDEDLRAKAFLDALGIDAVDLKVRSAADPGF